MNRNEQLDQKHSREGTKTENQSCIRNITPASHVKYKKPVQQSFSTPALIPQNQQISITPNPPNYPKGNKNSTMQPYVRIVEQPSPRPQRFRYPCESRSAGSIQGAFSTPENKSFTTIEILNWDKFAIVVVSCVDKDPPYRPHPHNVVGRDEGVQKYKDGICRVTFSKPPLRTSFRNLGIQCVKKTDIEKSLSLRNEKKINPFNVSFYPRESYQYDLNSVRLCFHAFISSTGEPGTWKPLDPVVSDPIDKKGISELVICQLCSCSAKVNGGDRIILLCEKVDKNDISIKFTEYNNDNSIKWSAYGVFQPHDIHKQTAITFTTPPYENENITEPVKVFIQLERPTDKAISEPLEFEYCPNPGMLTFNRIRRKIKHRDELEIFQQVLSLDSETTATKYSCPPTDLETCNDDNETVSSDSSASKPNSCDTLNEYDAEIRRRMARNNTTSEMDVVENTDHVRPHNMNIEIEVPHINYPVTDEGTQTSTPMDEILRLRQLPFCESRPLSAVDKITEWMRSSEFERTDSLTVENGDAASLSPVTVVTNITTYSPNTLTSNSTNTDDDKTFSELMEQVAELDDILARRGTLEQIIELDDSSSRRGTLEQLTELSEISSRRATLEQVPDLESSSSRRSTLDGATVKEFPINVKVNNVSLPTASAQQSLEVDENFDETATYTSLKISLKNPVQIPSSVAEFQNSSFSMHTNPSKIEEDISGLVVLTNPPAPKIKVNTAQTPPSPPSPPLPLPPRTPSPGPDQKVPPLPPKRRVSHELTVSKNSTPNSSFRRTERNGSLPARPPSQIIIMRTPEQSPTKRQSASPTPTASPKKKPGFFARLFSRKSKSDIKQDLPPTTPTPPLPPESPIKINSKIATPVGSREPSIGNFSLADPHRASVRSAKSLQPNSPGLSPHSSTNASLRSGLGKPVGRSSSSVSGKRPAHLNADVIHIPLKGDESEQPTISTFGRQLDRKTLSALQLADIPVCEGNMELVAIADRQSIKNLCEGDFGVILDPSVDLGEAEHFALYTSIVPPQDLIGNCNTSDNDSQNLDEDGQIITADEIAMRLAQANDTVKRKRLWRSRFTQDTANVSNYPNNFPYATNGHFPVASSSVSPNQWDQTGAAALPLPEFKVEPMSSPEHYPYSLAHSPIPQSSNGLKYTNLLPAQNGTHQFLMAGTSVDAFQSHKTQMGFMNGGSVQPIVSLSTSNVKSTLFMPNIPLDAPPDSSELTSEGRLVNEIARQLMADENLMIDVAASFQNNLNVNASSPNVRIDIGVPEQEGLTATDLIKELENIPLMEITSLPTNSINK